MKRAAILIVLAGLFCGLGASAQKAPEKTAAPAVQPAGDLASELAQRLGEQLHSKTVVGEPIKAGSVTLIPILMVDVNFAGGAAQPMAAKAAGIDGFLMSGESRPLGFVAITKKGTRFVSISSAAAK